MLLRYMVLLAVVVTAAGCVQERVVHDRRPVEREYVEVIAPQPPPERVVEVEPAGRPGYLWSRGTGVGKAGVMSRFMAIGSRSDRGIVMCIRTGSNVTMAGIGGWGRGLTDADDVS